LKDDDFFEDVQPYENGSRGHGNLAYDMF